MPAPTQTNDREVAELAERLAALDGEAARALSERIREWHDEKRQALRSALTSVWRELHEGPGEAESFLDRAKRLEERGETNAALDLIYDSFDELFHGGRMDSADERLRDTIVAEFETDLLIGILTATLPARSKLPSRGAFYEAVERELRERDELEPGLLAGLEQ